MDWSTSGSTVLKRKFNEDATVTNADETSGPVSFKTTAASTAVKRKFKPKQTSGSVTSIPNNNVILVDQSGNALFPVNISINPNTGEHRASTRLTPNLSFVNPTETNAQSQARELDDTFNILAKFE